MAKEFLNWSNNRTNSVYRLTEETIAKLFCQINISAGSLSLSLGQPRCRLIIEYLLSCRCFWFILIPDFCTSCLLFEPFEVSVLSIFPFPAAFPSFLSVFRTHPQRKRFSFDYWYTCTLYYLRCSIIFHLGRFIRCTLFYYSIFRFHFLIFLQTL